MSRKLTYRCTECRPAKVFGSWTAFGRHEHVITDSGDDPTVSRHTRPTGRR